MIDGVQQRIAAACQTDGRILAAFLYGSHVAGSADEHSDVDLCLIVGDTARDAVWEEREVLVRQLGEPLLLEDFDDDRTVYFILADGSVGEVTIADASHLAESSLGPGLADTFVAMDPATMLEAAHRIVEWYRAVVPDLAAAHGLPYPADLERIMTARLGALR